jgi:hypothetical protein
MRDGWWCVITSIAIALACLYKFFKENSLWGFVGFVIFLFASMAFAGLAQIDM